MHNNGGLEECDDGSLLKGLASYFASNRATFPHFCRPFQIRKFSLGQSNPTYLISTLVETEKDGAERKGEGGWERRGEVVVRKKPSGVVVEGAHQIRREYLTMEALHRVW